VLSRNCAQCSLRQEKQEVDVRHTPAHRKVSRSSLEVSCGSTHFTPPFAAAGRSFDPEPLPASTDPGAGSASITASALSRDTAPWGAGSGVKGGPMFFIGPFIADP